MEKNLDRKTELLDLAHRAMMDSEVFIPLGAYPLVVSKRRFGRFRRKPLGISSFTGFGQLNR